ncbi:MAG: hypothetical protein ACREMF_03130 [Gemmatimonadales bacterium]
MWIRDTDEALPISYRTWKSMLWLAQATDAWAPANTLRPPPNAPAGP